ncbi:hypothetical protein SKAU_G00309380 [Synaphobranchus kaupii]|uniref:Uncharacterized protein n=1 Tax=Synaphobranchus kaupii TaxID=118154 RepID=A0A9Q1ERB9_SYNKA|nr:hypothetical protein SKAU_G00309380 [Synaphobranchus kaupii]
MGPPGGGFRSSWVTEMDSPRSRQGKWQTGVGHKPLWVTQHTCLPVWGAFAALGTNRRNSDLEKLHDHRRMPPRSHCEDKLIQEHIPHHSNYILPPNPPSPRPILI